MIVVEGRQHHIPSQERPFRREAEAKAHPQKQTQAILLTKIALEFHLIAQNLRSVCGRWREKDQS